MMATTYAPLRAVEDQRPGSSASIAEDSSANTADEGESSYAFPTIPRQLYVSHFLSAWNVRGFEFGAVLFLATVFPGTLLPMSVYALVRAASAIVFSPFVGRYIDSGNRLQAIRISIGESFGSLSTPRGGREGGREGAMVVRIL